MSQGESFAAGLIGVVLDDRYRLDALLGEGGMGAVYRAHHLAMDRRVAVKLLKPHLTSDEAALQRFAREARSTMKVDSEHAVKVLDFGITPHRDYYMVLEYLDGRTVQRELDVDGPFAPSRVIHIATQALRALGAAHSRGLVHRDIKPDNLLLMRVGDDADYTKVLDFGVAKLMDGAAQSSRSALAITQAGMVFGTPEFMSPEQACGQPLDGRSDLYSLAATMFAMLTGCGMYKASTPMEWLMQHVRSPAPHLADGLPSLAPYTALDQALQSCLAKRREDRPRDAAAMIALLESVASTLGSPRARTRSAPASSAGARSLSAPSSFIAALDPDATLLPGTPIPPAGDTPHDLPHAPRPRPSSPVGPRDVSPFGKTLSATDASGLVPATTTGAAPAHRTRRGMWLVLGALAVVAVIVAAAVAASQKRSRASAQASRHTESRARATATASGWRETDALPVSPEAATHAPASGATDAGAGSDAREPGTGSGSAIPAADDPSAHGSATSAGVPGAAPPIRSTGPRPRPRASREAAAHLAAAEAAHRAGNRLRQLAEAHAALEADPRNVRARFLAADALISSGDLDRGCNYLRGLGKNSEARARAQQAGCPAD